MKYDTDTQLPSAPIVKDFDELCLAFGDQDAILLDDNPSMCYFEVQEYSKSLANQLAWRFRPDYVLIDCQGWPGAEAVATLACMRIRTPFVPVSCFDQHRPGRLNVVVDLLRAKGNSKSKFVSSAHPVSVVAVTVCDNDRDPILSVFEQADVHQILYLDMFGNLQEQLPVPSQLPPPPISTYNKDVNNNNGDDNLYILFTSGTSGKSPKAVAGSQKSLSKRLKWFRETFSPSLRIGRRTKLTFVDSITELWGSLLEPNSLLVAVPPKRLQIEGVKALLDVSCTQILLLPSQLHQLLLLEEKNQSLERVLVSGEPCPCALLHSFKTKYPQGELINLYGQTETTGDCCAVVLTSLDDDTSIVNGVVAVGTPICSANISTTPEHELIVNGNLSNGYLGDENSFTSFLTGDIGFCMNDIWYVQGRRDDVVKINGIWTCPAEVETAFVKVYPEACKSQVSAAIVDGHAYVVCPDADICNSFSRSVMHDSGIPWNLIPKSVICNIVPTKRGGAGKVNRKAVQELIQSSGDFGTSDNGSTTLTQPQTHESVVTLATRILNLNPILNELHVRKSFVELGGDSAKAVTLLYHLRNAYDLLDITAADILTAESLDELQSLINGDTTSKRRKVVDEDYKMKDSFVAFSPTIDPIHCNTFDRAFKLQACVDAKPLLIGKSIYAVCQGGVILKVSSSSEGIIESYRHLGRGWMIQADLVFSMVHMTIIVCAYNLSGKGMILSLSNDLKEVNWKRNFDGTVKSSPVLCENNSMSVVIDYSIMQLDVKTGDNQIKDPIQLPSCVISKPASIGEGKLMYASSEWDGGLILVEEEDGEKKISVYTPENTTIGPVYKDLMMLDDSIVIIADSIGFLHFVSLNKKKEKGGKANKLLLTCTLSIKISNSSLSSPLVLLLDDDKNKEERHRKILIGSYDGILRCVVVEVETNNNNKKNNSNKQQQQQYQICWECNCGAIIYTRPLALSDGNTIIVCTTAGDILRICYDNGEILWRYRILGEIWSDPVEVFNNNNNNNNNTSSYTPTIAFGARDSRLHIIKVGGGDDDGLKKKGKQ